MNGRTLTSGLAAVAAACAVLTGCGSETAPPSSPPTRVAPSTPAPGAPAGKVTDQPIERAASLSAGDRRVTVSAETGGCRTVRLLAAETPTRVTLTLRVTDAREPGRMCPDLARIVRVGATLHEPLGRRPLFDASTGHRVPTER